MRKGFGPPSMVPPNYPSYYEHFMDQYWAKHGTHEHSAQQEYLNTEKYGLYGGMQHEAHGNDMRRDAEIKIEYFDSPGATASRFEIPEVFHRQPSPQQKINTQKEKLEMKCQFCTSYFDNLAQLLGHLHLHLERVSSKDLGLVCMVKDCEYKAENGVNDDDDGNPRHISKYAQLRCIEQHIKSEHLNMQSWKCEFCDKEFNQKQSLVYHHKMHTDPTKEYCNICQRFRDAEKMSSHDAEKCARMAMVERKLECIECGKTFRSVPSLWLHKKIHTNERFICEFCNKAFTQKGNRKTHIMKKHIDKLYENPEYFTK